jgi:hypothetical protein
VMPWEPFKSQEELLLGAAAGDTTNREDLVWTVVICRVCTLPVVL